MPMEVRRNERSLARVGGDNDEKREGAKCPSTLPGQESITAREESAAGLARSRRWDRAA